MNFQLYRWRLSNAVDTQRSAKHRLRNNYTGHLVCKDWREIFNSNWRLTFLRSPIHNKRANIYTGNLLDRFATIDRIESSGRFMVFVDTPPSPQNYGKLTQLESSINIATLANANTGSWVIFLARIVRVVTCRLSFVVSNRRSIIWVNPFATKIEYIAVHMDFCKNYYTRNSENKIVRFSYKKDILAMKGLIRVG